jgi:hypothetical protein
VGEGAKAEKEPKRKNVKRHTISALKHGVMLKRSHLRTTDY